ncbi:MAG: hypothetical protein ACTS3F_00555 [Phycisphaerales bacterium]
MGAARADDPSMHSADRDLTRHRCLACGFDQPGLDRESPCPECGQTRYDAQADFMVRMWHIKAGADMGALAFIPLVMLAVLWMGSLAGAHYEDILVLAAFLLLAITVAYYLMSVWTIAESPLVIGFERRWITRATRACGVCVLPLLLVSWGVQFGSVIAGGAITAAGCVAAIGTIAGLRALRRELCALLGVPLPSGIGVYSALLRFCMVAMAVLMLGLIVWRVSAGGLGALSLALAPMAIAAYLLALEAARHALQRTLKAAGIGERPPAGAWR